MKTRTGLIAFTLSLSAAVPALAQAPTTVQLPSYSTFGASTTVSVPDRGRVSLGGVGRSSSGSTAFGPVLGPGSRSFGRQTSASSMDVRVRIHDFEAMDKALLEQAGRNQPRRDLSAYRRGMARHFNSSSSADQPPPGSVAEAQRLHAADVEAEQQKAVTYVRQARRSAARGKLQVAKVLYQMAERRATGELKAEIRRELADLREAPAPEDVSQVESDKTR